MNRTARTLVPAVAVLAALTAACRSAPQDVSITEAAFAAPPSSPEKATTTTTAAAERPVAAAQAAALRPATTTTTSPPEAAVQSAPAPYEEPVDDPQAFPQYYNDITFTDPHHGWAVGGFNGAIIATSDGGRSWHVQPAPTDGHELTSISFVSPRRGWAAGFGGTILGTDDGGQTWRRLPAPAGDYLAMTFVDNRRGWAVGNGGLIVATVDGGATWRVQSPMDWQKPMLTRVFFVDSRHGWAAGEVSMVTADGGETWEAVPEAGGFALDFVDRRTGWVVNANRLLKTTDGGAVWSSSEIAPAGLFLTDVDFVNRSDGWVAGMQNDNRSFIGRTTDGGATWTFGELPGVTLLRAVAAYPWGDTWAAGIGIIPVD